MAWYEMDIQTDMSPLYMYKILKMVGFVFIAVGVIVVGMSFGISYYVTEYEPSTEVSESRDANDYVAIPDQGSEESLRESDYSAKFSELSAEEKEEFMNLLREDKLDSSQLYDDGIYQVIYEGDIYLVESEFSGEIVQPIMFGFGVLLTVSSIVLVIYSYHRANWVRVQKLREDPVEFVDTYWD